MADESTSLTNQPLRYASYVYDNETELYYLKARYYDQETARFISRDPHSGSKDNPLNQNAYAYANGDPVNNVDPDGKFALPRFATYFAAAAGGVTIGVVTGLLLYYYDVKRGNIEPSDQLMKSYVLKGAGYGIIGAVSFAGITAGLASGSILSFYDYFATVPKSQWNYLDATVSITSGALFGIIGGRFLPRTPVGKFLAKKLRL